MNFVSVLVVFLCLVAASFGEDKGPTVESIDGKTLERLGKVSMEILIWFLFKNIELKFKVCLAKNISNETNYWIFPEKYQTHAFPEGINSHISNLKTQALQFSDQSAIVKILERISSLFEEISNVQKNVLKIPKEIIAKKILEINQKHLKLMEDWEKFEIHGLRKWIIICIGKKVFDTKNRSKVSK